MAFELRNLVLDLGQRPQIAQTGLSVHGYAQRETFLMKDLWGLHIYMWEGDLRIGAARFAIHNGSLSITPPNTSLEWHFPDHAPHYYVHFALADRGGAPKTFPIMQELGESFDWMCSELEQIIGLFPYEKLQAEVRLWAVLWRLTLPPAGSGTLAPQVHPKVQIAMSFIENNLVRSISVEALARQVGTSHNHLTNLFRASFGKTVIQYVRERRCRKAEHLLRNSSLPVKSVAIQVGIPDLQHFNKTIRRELGKSPRQIRSAAK